MGHEIGHAGLPSFIDCGELRWKSNLAKTLMNSLALGAIPKMRHPGERYDSGSESSTTASARVSHTIRPVNFWGRSNCMVGTGLYGRRRIGTVFLSHIFFGQPRE